MSDEDLETFCRVALMFRPLSYNMASRFTSANMTPEEEEKRLKARQIAEQSARESTEQSEKDLEETRSAAAAMAMFGRLTREEFEWHPARLLCKRFNVPDPYPQSGHVGVKPSASAQMEIDLLAEEIMDRAGETGEFRMGLGPEIGPLAQERKNRAREKEERERANAQPSQGEDPLLTVEKPTMDLFKSIFADDSDDEEEDDEEEEEEEEKEKEKEKGAEGEALIVDEKKEEEDLSVPMKIKFVPKKRKKEQEDGEKSKEAVVKKGEGARTEESEVGVGSAVVVVGTGSSEVMMLSDATVAEIAQGRKRSESPQMQLAGFALEESRVGVGSGSATAADVYGMALPPKSAGSAKPKKEKKKKKKEKKEKKKEHKSKKSRKERERSQSNSSDDSEDDIDAQLLARLKQFRGGTAKRPTAADFM